MKISRSMTYALNALIQLAVVENDAPTPCSRIAAHGEMPERFLLQILRHLVNHGLLISTRGVVGGYRLARPADEISLRDIVDALAATTSEASAPMENLPEHARLQLAKVIDEVEAATAKRLEKVKLADLIAADTAHSSVHRNEARASVESEESIALRQSDV